MNAPARGEEFKDDVRRALAPDVVALGLAAATGHLVQYLVLWILPLATVVQALLRLRAICEHGAVGDTGSPLTAARTNLCPAWVTWLLFPHNVNFHIEHHLYASVPMHKLPALHRELASRGLLEGAAVTPFPATLEKIFADPLPQSVAH